MIEVQACRLYQGDALEFYREWDAPDVIMSDGAYGVGGFDGDPYEASGLGDWYEPHIKEWSERAKDRTTLWFWNTEVGWATVHPVLERYGWKYVHSNVWDKGMGHIAGNVNTQTLRHFPVVTELCAQYVREVRVGSMTLREWLKAEWVRSGLPQRKANEACGVKDAAVRKYFDQGKDWYCPSPEMFAKLSEFANRHGAEEGKPYYSFDGGEVATAEAWAEKRAFFQCPHGQTNVWTRNTVRGSSRATEDGKAIHPNQKPCDLLTMLVEASSRKGDVLWEPFGGLFTGSLAAGLLRRRAFGAEISTEYLEHAAARLRLELEGASLPMVENALFGDES